ncbi:BRCA1-associated protein, partial [Geosmithia morbida]
LYSTPTPGAERSNSDDDGDDDDDDDIWVPPAQADIFDDNLPSHAHAHAPAATQDWRFGRVSVQTVSRGSPSGIMAGEQQAEPGAAPSLGPTLGSGNRAEYVPLHTKNTELGWGIVHFYREGEESQWVTRGNNNSNAAAAAAAAGGGGGGSADNEGEGDCTTLCIPAVPAWMTPSDFLGFIGERWQDDIGHYRMVMTSKMNKYLALLRFRNSDSAKKWKKEFDGKVFNTTNLENCHVVFVKRITFDMPGQRVGEAAAAASTTAAGAAEAGAGPSSSSSTAAVSNTPKPFPPPAPNLVELPTCPVCLERMDETSGLMTIPCSHVFHCTCLKNWKGSGCPVCRFTNAPRGYEGDGGERGDPTNPYSQPFGASVSNLCSVCDSSEDLWICLICGRVGCGRYKGGHAKDHWKETAHSFALELETQYVWDYAEDAWVHRLIRNKGDGKVVELPVRSGTRGGRRSRGRGHGNGYDDDDGDDDNDTDGDDGDVVPRAKLESIGFEYSQLITSQLESQRTYYEEQLKKAIDMVSEASGTAESAKRSAETAAAHVAELEEKHRRLADETVPQLERDLERERRRAAKSQDLARSLGNSVQEEKRINEGLVERIHHLEGRMNEALRQVEGLKGEKAELEEMNRDLTMFIS